MHRSDLYPSLNEVRYKVQSLLQILLGALRIADEEPELSAPVQTNSGSSGYPLESSSHVVRLRLSLFPADPLIDRLVDKGYGVVVVCCA